MLDVGPYLEVDFSKPHKVNNQPGEVPICVYLPSLLVEKVAMENKL